MPRVLLHPLPLRLWHWINAACFLVLIATGIQIRYHLLTRVTFKSSVQVHNVAALALLISFVFWGGYQLWSRKLRGYVPTLNRAWVRASWLQVRYYAWGMLRGDPNPHHVSLASKFNPLQQLTYLSVLWVLLPLQIASGILLWDPQRFSSILSSVSGLKIVASCHVVIFVLFVAFTIAHVYLTTLGHSPTAHIKAMYNGYEDLDDNGARH